ncbi:Similar to PREDICTED: hypothetical protein LOC100635540 [Amphimedon queenslandica]; acc. no. XP_003390264 [Pyronema omphalodes CBS 100304]|uniref:Tyr recombinase domain-containing protein n=1 Tax=Pyronema omphalodes (strain CBS 100304) TaxID=1076935 RepID=U4LTC6_PYROM|nr:Similar to PREDICTED: hypothetical protein LOC100635540 [Amphimedon queenslandica]; acc. no. XP_003390264 [Pyronema omphalodes CBS 100304]
MLYMYCDYRDKERRRPLFQRSNGRPFTRNYVIDSLRSLTAAQIPGHFSGHSFRRGAAATAQKAGLPQFQNQLLGRWKSDAFRAYVDADPSDITRLARRLHGITNNRS